MQAVAVGKRHASYLQLLKIVVFDWIGKRITHSKFLMCASIVDVGDKALLRGPGSKNKSWIANDVATKSHLESIQSAERFSLIVH
ncbi:hypothetical protein ACVJF1_007505 [Bradyrhizobium diazoefficiens]